ncbi:MAG TPA: ABC transporter substrate-binding protein, partial [Baekduia sp.]|nr:ABC transporter substrate-binding protein [Baekduia sp.]
MINDEAGPITFPQARQGSIAAAAYVNNYLGGINGHPIKIENCVGDASPATAARCANQLVAKKPVAILGAADVGESASLPTYARANLAYLGGIPLTPVPLKSPNSIQFSTVSYGDPIASAQYAGKNGVKSVAIVFTDNPTGREHLTGIISAFNAAGVNKVTKVPVSPTSPDPSPQAALVQSSNADAVFIALPGGCGNLLKSLKSVGYSGKVFGNDTCGSPPVIKAAAGAADGVYFSSPFVLQNGSTKEAQLFQASMKKWAAPGTLIDSVSTSGFATVMNVQSTLSQISG